MTTTQPAGSFWAANGAAQFIEHYLDALHSTDAQTQLDVATLASGYTRADAPLYRRYVLHPLTLSRNTQQDSLTWPAPDGLVDVTAITDRITTPTYTLHKDVDFWLRDGTIVFRVDPLPAGIADLTLWLHDADYDTGYLDDLWGTALGLSAPASVEYRTLLSIIYDALIGGTSRKHIEQLIALFSGTDTFTLYTMNEYIRESELDELTIPKNMLDATIGEDLTFVNYDIPLEFSDGRVEFTVLGAKNAVAQFWRLFNERKTSDGKTLADLLAGQTTVNPFRFVRRNVLGANCLLCVLCNPRPPETLAGIDFNKILRLILPPHESLLVALQPSSTVP